MMKRTTEMVWKNVCACRPRAFVWKKSHLKLHNIDRGARINRNVLSFFKSCDIAIDADTAIRHKNEIIFWMYVCTLEQECEYSSLSICLSVCIFSVHSQCMKWCKLQRISSNHSFNVYRSAKWNKSHQCHREMRRRKEKKRQIARGENTEKSNLMPVCSRVDILQYAFTTTVLSVIDSFWRFNERTNAKD